MSLLNGADIRGVRRIWSLLWLPACRSETNREILSQEQQLWGWSGKGSEKGLIGCITRPHGDILGLEWAQEATWCVCGSSLGRDVGAHYVCMIP